MLRFTRCSRDSFKYFRETRLGQELALRTKQDMNNIHKSQQGGGGQKGGGGGGGGGGGSNFVTRFLTRKRAVDRMQVEIDTHTVSELHWSFGYLMKFWTMLVVTPFITALFAGKVAPTQFLYRFGFTTKERYEAIWEHANILWVLFGQAMVAIAYYDLSIYWRYPVYKYVFAPIYRRYGLYRPAAQGSFELKDLKSGAARRKVQEQLRNSAPAAGGNSAGAAGKKSPISGAKASVSFTGKK